MYFYRLMSKEELKEKNIKCNIEHFEDSFNTHKYKKGINYVHLFLNAESCFEDFVVDNIDDMIIAKFDIPDEIVCKYGIGLGGYDLFHNKSTRKYRYMCNRNEAGGLVFWVPEICIPSYDFNYDWCIKTYNPIKELYMYVLPKDFQTDDIYYREIVNDGYLIGYKNEFELLDKYKSMLKIKKKIIDILKTTRQININPRDLNNDSMLAANILLNYALEQGFINKPGEIVITLSNDIKPYSINITSDDNENEAVIINKNYHHSVPSFCAMLDKLGFNVDTNIFKSINNDDEEVIDYSLIKKCE